MNTSTHKHKAAGFIFLLFSVAVLFISALTSFSFFYTYFPNLIPSSVLDPVSRSMISGGIGMLLFDVAAVIWLFTYLYHSGTSEQRAVSLAMTLITFLGASAASIAYLSLQANGAVELASTTKETIGLVSLIVVIGGIIANFGSAQMHHRFSSENKRLVQESDRQDAIQLAENEQASYLDKLITQQMKEQLNQIAPELAEQQARKLAHRFYNLESSKYAKTGNLGGLGEGLGDSEEPNSLSEATIFQLNDFELRNDKEDPDENPNL